MPQILRPSSSKVIPTHDKLPATPSNETLPGCFEWPITRNPHSSNATAADNDSESEACGSEIENNCYSGHADEIEQHLLGPMPLAMFLKKYLPLPDTDQTMPIATGAFDVIPGNCSEKGFCDRLAQALNDSSRRCPGIKFFNTMNDSEHGPKINICGYLERFGEKRLMPRSVETFVLVKSQDFACDTPEEDEEFLYGHIQKRRKLTSAVQALGQQVKYAVEIFAQQHRNFLFSIFLTPTHARFLRWDRAGVIVSEAFEYRANPDILCSFLWRFGHMTDEQRGYDATVTTASEKEEEIFKTAIKAHVRSQLGTDYENLEDEYNHHYQPGRVVKIPVRKRMQVTTVEQELEVDKLEDGPEAETTQEKVTFDESQEVVEFLVSRPVTNPITAESLAFRATRGYWAVHVENRTVHFLKDTWRTVLGGMEIEGRILEKLTMEGVKNIPELLCWSDVGPKEQISYRTETDKYRRGDDHKWNMHWRCKNKKFTQRIHYRQVVNEAGYTLEHLSGTLELLKGARDVFHALCDARLKCKRLHRDVNSSNIILFADGQNKYSQRRGILIDWELSCKDEEGFVRDHWISGTWAFMSIAMLKNLRPHHFGDDVESLIYVVFYCAIHSLPWQTYNAVNHAAIIIEFLNEYLRQGHGGSNKLSNALIGEYFQLAQFDDVSPWLLVTLPIIATLALTSPPSHEDVIKEYQPMFEQSSAYWESLQQNNRSCNAHIYTGPQKDVILANESWIDTCLQTPMSTHTSGSLSKRPLQEIEEHQSSESRSRRRRINEVTGNVAAGQVLNIRTSCQRLRKSDQLS